MFSWKSLTVHFLLILKPTDLLLWWVSKTMYSVFHVYLLQRLLVLKKSKRCSTMLECSLRSSTRLRLGYSPNIFWLENIPVVEQHTHAFQWTSTSKCISQRLYNSMFCYCTPEESQVFLYATRHPADHWEEHLQSQAAMDMHHKPHHAVSRGRFHILPDQQYMLLIPEKALWGFPGSEIA